MTESSEAYVRRVRRAIGCRSLWHRMRRWIWPVLAALALAGLRETGWWVGFVLVAGMGLLGDAVLGRAVRERVRDMLVRGRYGAVSWFDVAALHDVVSVLAASAGGGEQDFTVVLGEIEAHLLHRVDTLPAHPAKEQIRLAGLLLARMSCRYATGLEDSGTEVRLIRAVLSAYPDAMRAAVPDVVRMLAGTARSESLVRVVRQASMPKK
ncbi:MAG: hypothetical protein ACKO5K_06095 [Armatimonadota bacterium]